ncbi:hypothetical protein CR513_28978, partial [Mucuna pruriens]
MPTSNRKPIPYQELTPCQEPTPCSRRIPYQTRGSDCLSPQLAWDECSAIVVGSGLMTEHWQRLPPLKGIKHHIDLTLEETLTNRDAYRTNPKEV